MHQLNRNKNFNNLFSIIFVIVILHFSGFVFGQEEDNYNWNFLSTTKIGASQFIKQNPTFDGRGVIIFVLDSGVDMGVAGLTTTSTGEVKVVDVRDFSGQGDVSLYLGEAGTEGREKFIEHPTGFRLYNYHRLDKTPIEDEYLIGYIDERNFRNSDVRDINNNGKYDDTFGVLVFEVEAADTLYWIAYVDTDGDHHIDDEHSIRDYRVNYDTIHFRGGNKKYDRRLLTCAINILPDEMKLSFHFDDDGHGTHVAGIASGYQISNEEGFHGIAPGAQIISLKIGNGTFKGGCTVSGSFKNALDFVEQYARKNRKPVVVNISYGIGSVREGESYIDELVNDVLFYNKNIFVCISAGNEGPGISTAGTPAAANKAFTVGALLNRASAKDIYGANLPGDAIFYFSARGGELNKPDAVVPGVASSTVPKFSDDDIMRGTSMASPQAAGAAAILWSAAVQSDPPLMIHNTVLKRALKNTAVPLKEYSFLDQGEGLVQIDAAFDFLKEYSTAYAKQKIIEYRITTENPLSTNNQGRTAFWRTAGFFPSGGERQKFTVRPVFHDSLDADAKAEFYRSFKLTSSHPWLRTTKNSMYLKGVSASEIDVTYNKKLLEQPGIYTGKIYAHPNVSSSIRDKYHVEFELLNTIIVPYTFTQENNYQQKFLSKRIAAGNVDRYFIQVPTGATVASITFSPTKNKFCNVDCFAYTPDGSKYFRIGPISSKEENDEIRLIPTSDLTPGIWEIDIYADFLNEKTSTYNFEIAFSSYLVEPPVISNFNYEVGQEPNGYFNVTNQFNIPFYGFSRGKISGFQRTRKNISQTSDIFSYDFNVENEVNSIEFNIEIAEESFIKMTDVAVNIYNSRGTAIYKEAFSQNEKKISLSRLADDSYTLELLPAFVYRYGDTRWSFSLQEKYFLNDDINIKIYQDNERIFKLFPLIRDELEFTLNKSPRIAPEGFHIFGSIDFYDRNLLQQVFTVPIEFKLQ